ncbi:MFS general substrate transporter [Peniophora sp. CONT]|nr:MFS general substrate transporter [Peniophora sp. CONT]
MATFRLFVTMSGLLLAFFAAYLEASVVSTALDTIAAALHANEVVWLGTSYSIAFTALLPLTGGLLDALGRKPIMFAGLVIFTVGSVLAGAAQTMEWLVGARSLSGLGAGVIGTSGMVVLADLIPLSKRGFFMAFIGVVMCMGIGFGPLIGGALSDAGQWRWCFFIVAPLLGAAAIVVLLFFHLPQPDGDIFKKLRGVDWIGTALVAGGTTAIIIGVTWGGVQAPWSSGRVIAPLVVGAVSMLAFFAYEFTWAKNPLVVLSNRTSVSGYVQTFVLSIPYNAILYYLPIYYQAVLGATPTQSGIDLLSLTFTVPPTTIFSGIYISHFKSYRLPIWLGWILLTLGTGLLASLDANSGRGASIGYPAIIGVGIGLVFSSLQFPILAPLEVEMNARALSLHVFLRAFSQTWGIAIGGAVLQSQLVKRLPASVLPTDASKTQIAFALIPTIAQLPPSERDAVRVAFADSLSVAWWIMFGITCVGLVASFAMGNHKMAKKVDKKWQAKDGEDNKASSEDGAVPESGEKLSEEWVTVSQIDSTKA